MKKRLLALLSFLTITLLNITPASAKTVSGNGEINIPITASVTGSFEVLLPNNIETTSNAQQEIPIIASGNIAGNETLLLSVNEEIVLSAIGKENETASVSLRKTHFTSTELANRSISNMIISIGPIPAGSWTGICYINIGIKNGIAVTATDSEQTNLNAYSYVIEGEQKENLLNTLIQSGIADDSITSTEDVDALVEVESDDFDSIAETTFDMSGVAEEGETVVVLHFDETKQEWEYIGAYEVTNGKVTADFTSYSPVAFVVVGKNEEVTHVHSYTETINSAPTCTATGLATYTCECGNTETRTLPIIDHNYVGTTCENCGATKPQENTNGGLYDSNGILLCSWDTLEEEYGFDIEAGPQNVPGDDATEEEVTAWLNSDAWLHNIITNYYPSATKVVIPEGTQSIGQCAFMYCASITEIIIPNSAIEIQDNVFVHCDALEKIVIPDSVERMSEFAFYETPIPDSLTIPTHLLHYFPYMDIRELHITAGSTGIIPDVIVDEGDEDDISCDTLQTLIIGEGIIEIGDNAFIGCKGIQEVILPNSITRIGKNAFRNCSGLTNIYMPDSITSIGNRAFQDCSNLTEIMIPNSVTEMGEGVFYNCTNLQTANLPSNITQISAGCFAGCTSLAEITIPNSVNQIGDGAFMDCVSLTDVTIPNSVTSIGTNAFVRCSNLTTVTMSNSVTFMGDFAFGGCTGLVNGIVIPDSITLIGEDAFRNIPIVYYNGTLNTDNWGAVEVRTY